MLRKLCCCCGACEEGETATFDNAISLDSRRTFGALVASKYHAARAGQVLAEQSVLQDRAYWEITLEGEAKSPSLAVGVVSPAHTLGERLGNGRTSWVLQSSELPRPLKAGDVIGVALNQSDFPVTLRFFLNGKLCNELMGPSTESTPVVALHTDDTAVAVNFGATSFSQSAPSGYGGLIKSRSII
ncbi:hypothetical protein AB1Y20_009958 [Prymnesium parvum]|uniref:SPRY domain-containing protein 7 n=1 Tax=Prymnesium parvum TaxID=97485 RepID=A0AB34K3K9_PRYPA